MPAILPQFCTLHSLTPDGRLLFITRFTRMFAYGFLSIVLVLYLRPTAPRIAATPSPVSPAQPRP